MHRPEVLGAAPECRALAPHSAAAVVLTALMWAAPEASLRSVLVFPGDAWPQVRGDESEVASVSDAQEDAVRPVGLDGALGCREEQGVQPAVRAAMLDATAASGFLGLREPRGARVCRSTACGAAGSGASQDSQKGRFGFSLRPQCSILSCQGPANYCQTDSDGETGRERPLWRSVDGEVARREGGCQSVFHHGGGQLVPRDGDLPDGADAPREHPRWVPCRLAG